MNLFKNKEITSTDILTYYLPLLKDFAENNNLDVTDVVSGKYGYDKNSLEVKFSIKDLNKLKEKSK